MEQPGTATCPRRRLSLPDPGARNSMPGPSRVVQSLTRMSIRGSSRYSQAGSSLGAISIRESLSGACSSNMLRECPTLTDRIEGGAVGFTVRRPMRNLRTEREKNLDIVVCTPNWNIWFFAPPSRCRRYLQPRNHAFTPRFFFFEATPRVHTDPRWVSLICALEAKAWVTARIEALPRVYDELNSRTLHRDPRYGGPCDCCGGRDDVNLADTS